MNDLFRLEDLLETFRQDLFLQLKSNQTRFKNSTNRNLCKTRSLTKGHSTQYKDLTAGFKAVEKETETVLASSSGKKRQIVEKESPADHTW